jgi:hypothetical protein
MMHLTITERGRTSKAIATGVTTALALTAVAVPGAFARPADPMHTAAADRALAAQGSTAPSDLRTPDATDAADATVPQVSSSSPVRIVRAEQSTTSGFDWGDAAIGAGGTFAAVALSGGAVMALSRRRGRPAGASKTAGVAV